MTHALTLTLGGPEDLAWAQATVTASHYLRAPVDQRARPMTRTNNKQDPSMIELTLAPTAPAIAIIGADMRAVCAAEPAAPHASTQRTLPALIVTLPRSHGHWMLSLLSTDGPIPQAAADQWAAAVGAPSVEWWRTREGWRVQCDWVEVEPCV